MKGNRTESYLSSSTTVARYLEMEKEKDVECIGYVYEIYIAISRRRLKRDFFQYNH